MKKKSEKMPLLGLVKERTCLYPKREGTLRWWDASKGAPMGLGPEGERWAVEWHPGGRGKPLYVHLRTRDIASRCFRDLAKGETDRWGLFEILEKEKSGDVSQIVSPPDGGGGGTALGPIARGTPISAALVERFDADRIVGLFEDLLSATRPIYASIEGDQQVVGYEPDWATRRDGIKTMLAYRDGLPVKKIEEIRRSETSPEEGLAHLASNPKARARLQEYCNWLDERDEKRMATVVAGREVKGDG